MPKRNSLPDDLLTLPYGINLILAAVVYFGLKFYLPTVEFRNPAFQVLRNVFPQHGWHVCEYHYFHSGYICLARMEEWRAA